MNVEQIQINKAGNNVTYIIKDKNCFSQIDYKVMENNDNSGLICPMKYLYNDNIALLYITEDYQSLSKSVANLNTNTFVSMMISLLESYLAVKNNGFLDCRNIDLSTDRIYINQSNYKVNLLYIPVSTHLYEDEQSSINELRSSLLKIIDSNPEINGKTILQLKLKLMDSRISLEETVLSLKTSNEAASINNSYTNNQSNKTQRVLRLKPISSGFDEIVINSGNAVIGRNSNVSDKVINCNTVGRKHCTITNNATVCYVIDEDSKNGTFINDKKIMPNIPETLRSGDRLRLSSVEYVVSFD